MSVQSRTYRVGYVDVVNISDCDSRGPGQYPDPLIPDVDSYFGQTRNALPVTVPTGENRQLLIDLFVPPDAKPGSYQGAVAVSTADAQGLVTLPFNLQVFAHTLPSTASMQSDYGMSKKSIAAGHHMSATDLDSPAQQQLYKRYLDAGLMYRISGGSAMQTALGFADFEEQYGSFVNKTGRDLPFGMRGARLTAVRLPCNTLGNGDGSHHGCPVFVATNSSWANASAAWTKSVTRYWAAVYANFSRHGDGREQVSLSLHGAEKLLALFCNRIRSKICFCNVVTAAFAWRSCCTTIRLTSPLATVASSWRMGRATAPRISHRSKLVQPHYTPWIRAFAALSPRSCARQVACTQSTYPRACKHVGVCACVEFAERDD